MYNNHHIFEAEFMVSEPFFDNTAYLFYTATSILNFNPNSKNPFVFLFLINNVSSG